MWCNRHGKIPYFFCCCCCCEEIEWYLKKTIVWEYLLSGCLFGYNLLRMTCYLWFLMKLKMLIFWEWYSIWNCNYNFRVCFNCVSGTTTRSGFETNPKNCFIVTIKYHSCTLLLLSDEIVTVNSYFSNCCYSCGKMILNESQAKDYQRPEYVNCGSYPCGASN